jgi:hypothetical protein
MRDLHVRPTWEVGDNDLDVMALRPDDDPYIPHGIENPPVLRAVGAFAGSKKGLRAIDRLCSRS